MFGLLNSNKQRTVSERFSEWFEMVSPLVEGSTKYSKNIVNVKIHVLAVT